MLFKIDITYIRPKLDNYITNLKTRILLSSDTFSDRRKVVTRTRVELDHNKYCFVSVSQHWIEQHSETAKCGKEIAPIVEFKYGLSKEFSENKGIDLGINLGLISNKIIYQTGMNLTISTEKTISRPIPVKAPECGKETTSLYQLTSNWHIEPYTKGFFGKPRPREPYDISVPENKWSTEPTCRINVIPECNHKCECKPAKFLLSKSNNKILKHNWMHNNLHNRYSNGDS